jgi:MFS transporter, SET family, sugar efflux transporter
MPATPQNAPGPAPSLDSSNEARSPGVRTGAAVAALAGAVGAFGVSISIISTTTSLYLANVVHAGALTIGLFFAARGAVGMVTSLAGGRLSDRVRDRRRPLALSGLAGALGAASFAVLHGYAAVFVAGVLLLNLGAVAFSQLFAYSREHAEARQIGATAFTTAIRSVFSAAWVVGPPFGFFLLSRYGYRPLYLAAAGLFLLTALLGRFGLPRLPLPQRQPDPPKAASAETGPRPPSPLLHLGRRTYLLLSATVVLGVVNQMYMIDIALYVTKDLHLGASLVGWMAGLGAALEIPIMIFAGRVADRFGKLRLVIAASGAAVVFFCLLPLAGSAPALLALQVPNAAWTAIALSLPMIMIQEEVTAGAGTSAALYSTAYTSAGLVAGAVTGVTAAALGFRNVFWVCAALSLVATLLLLARRPADPHREGTGRGLSRRHRHRASRSA